MQQKNVHWYPGHMKKAFIEIEARLKMIDVVVEVVDARVPIASKNPFLSRLIEQKKKLLVFSKSDLCSKEALLPFLTYYQKLGYVCIQADLFKESDIERIRNQITRLGEEKQLRYQSRGMKPQPIRVLVLGIPNVGKSTLINKISKRTSASTANTPGHTRAQQWVKGQSFALLDTPGILPPHYEDKMFAIHLALIGAIKEDILPHSELVSCLLDFLLPTYEEKLCERFQLISPLTKVTILEQIGLKRGLLLRGGTADIEAAERLLLKEFKEGRIVKTVVDTLC